MVPLLGAEQSASHWVQKYTLGPLAHLEKVIQSEAPELLFEFLKSVKMKSLGVGLDPQESGIS